MYDYTVITVVKNNRCGIETTINSVLSQKDISIEYIVIDCNSTDGTSEIINRYRQKLTHLREKDEGLYDALNKGIALSKGEYICLLHSNDVYASNNILKENHDFLKSNNLDGSFANINIFKEKKLYRKWRYKIKKINKFNSFLIAHPSLVLKRKIYEELKLKYKIEYQISSDLDFIINLNKIKQLKIMHFDRFISNCQHGGLSTDIAHFKLKTTEDIKILKEHFKYIYFFIYLIKLVSKLKNFLFKIYLFRK